MLVVKMEENDRFDDVSLLITHYNRSRSLENLLKSFAGINCLFNEIIVSDDGSNIAHINHLESLQHQFPFRLVTTSLNKGLGNNINKGQDAVKSKYTLYVQEDFQPADNFKVHLTRAVEIMQDKNDVDMIRFYAYFKYPYLKYYKHGFSEMTFRLWKPGYKKFYSYSDHPHLRRSNFLKRFGRYTEGVKGDVTEYRMMMSFLQNEGKSLFYEDYQNLFQQVNSHEEPSTMKRDFWRESGNPLVAIVREFYRHARFNIDFIFKKY